MGTSYMLVGEGGAYRLVYWRIRRFFWRIGVLKRILQCIGIFEDAGVLRILPLFFDVLTSSRVFYGVLVYWTILAYCVLCLFKYFDDLVERFKRFPHYTSPTNNKHFQRQEHHIHIVIVNHLCEPRLCCLLEQHFNAINSAPSQ